MIRLRVLDLLQEKKKTKYWLYIQLGMSYQNFNNMVNNKTKSIEQMSRSGMRDFTSLFCAPQQAFIKRQSFAHIQGTF